MVLTVNLKKTKRVGYIKTHKTIMARVSNKPAQTANGTATVANKLIVDKELGFVMLENVTRKANVNGKEYIAIPGHGATYINLDGIKPNVVYKVVQFKTNDETTSGVGSLGLNNTTQIEKLQYFSSMFPNASLTEIKEMFGI
jgi:hypothetical protein